MATYLITFSCYGSHIPGQQGAIDRDHNAPGSRLPEPRPKLRQYVDAALKQAPFEMDADQRAITLDAIREVCQYKRWRLFAVQVRSNHVHTVVDAEVSPELVMNAFKAYASRALNLADPQERGRFRWARHGSTRLLRSQENIGAAIHYVLEEQGEPMAFVCPLPDGRSSAHEPPCVSMRTGEKRSEEPGGGASLTYAGQGQPRPSEVSPSVCPLPDGRDSAPR